MGPWRATGVKFKVVLTGNGKSGTEAVLLPLLVERELPVFAGDEVRVSITIRPARASKRGEGGGSR